MQLPRGTFREIKKGVPVSALLEEIEKTGFSGICSFSYGESTGTIVFKGGKGILAKFLNKNGDLAYEELQKLLEEEVDAALSTLDEAQIQLALEFNRSSRLSASRIPAKAPTHKHVQVPQPAQAPQPSRAGVISPHVPPKISHHPQAPHVPQFSPPPERPLPPLHHPPTPPRRPVVSTPPPAQVATPAAPLKAKLPQPVPEQKVTTREEKESDESVGPNTFETDIDTFDSMDLENVTAKIRSDCKTMIKQLNLEHLIDR